MDAYIRGMLPFDLAHCVVIIDEAHNIVRMRIGASRAGLLLSGQHVVRHQRQAPPRHPEGDPRAADEEYRDEDSGVGGRLVHRRELRSVAGGGDDGAGGGVRTQ